MSQQDAVDAASHIGFAIATITAFRQRPGISMEQIEESLERLRQALGLVAKLIDA
jgi:hypothetical protein